MNKNLYQINPWTNPDFKCEHSRSIFCKECHDEFIKLQQPLEPEFEKFFWENYWELLE